MEDLERMNELNKEVNISIQEKNVDINSVDIITEEKITEYINKIKNNGKIELKDFNIYNKIKKNNQISPLMIYILQNAIEKYNDNKKDNGIEGVGFGYYPGITDKSRENNNIYFDSDNAYVLYVTFSEEFIGNFWATHQLLSIY